MWCPFCGSPKMRKAGFSITSTGRHQRFECRQCRRFTIKPIQKKEPVPTGSGS